MAETALEKCPTCGKEFKPGMAIRMHVLRAHGRLKNVNTRPKKKDAMPKRKYTKRMPNVNGEETVNVNPIEDHSFQNHVSYALGHVETWLEFYARGHGVSTATLTRRVAEILLRAARR